MPIHNIVLATDLSVRCDRALDRAIKFAAEQSARLVVVHALQDPAVDDHLARRRLVDPLLVARRKVHDDVGVHDNVEIDVVVEHSDPAELILKVAENTGCDLIVTGTARDEALGRIFLGTTVNTLARQTDIPVLVVKSRPRHPYMHIVVATDFSEGSRAALEAALALFPHAQVILFHAFDVLYETFITDLDAARASAHRQAMEKCRAFIESAQADKLAKARILSICEYGYTGALLNELVVARNINLVVLGTAGRSGVAGFLLGSNAQTLATEVAVDVLLVRRAKS